MGPQKILHPLNLSDAPHDRAGLEFSSQPGGEMGLVILPGRWLIYKTMALS